MVKLEKPTEDTPKISVELPMANKYVNTQVSSSSSDAHSTNVRAQKSSDLSPSKCVSTGVGPTFTEIGLPIISQDSSIANSIGKQKASGDTGDNNAICDQDKWRLISDSSSMNSSLMHFQSPNNALGYSELNKQNASSHGTKALNIGQTNYTNNDVENKTNLIINYLPPNMSQEEVRALFSSIGEVESCKLVREKTSGESLGYAFVKFFDSSDAGKAIKTLNGLRLQNKTVKVSLARPSSEAIKGANLYICGLPRKMSQNELEKLFSSCGHIITARILYDTKTGLSRGVAFIRYDQRTEAEIAILRLNGFLPPGATEPITVKFANSPSSNRVDQIGQIKQLESDTSPGKFSLYGPQLIDIGRSSECLTNGDELGHNLTQTTSRLHPLTNRLTTHPLTNKQPSPIGSTIPQSRTCMVPTCVGSCNELCNFKSGVERSTPGSTVGGGHQGCDHLHSQMLSNGFPMAFNRTSVPSAPQDVNHMAQLQRPAGTTRVKSQSAAVGATGMPNGTALPYRASNNFLGSPLSTTFPTGMPRLGMDFMRGLGSGAQALLAPAFAASSGALTATGWCIFVYNLAAETEDSILWQLFGPFGAVQTVKVIHDPLTGKCKGFGFVTMSNYEEALLAIHSLNGFNLGNRVLQVSFKTTPNNRQMKFIPGGGGCMSDSTLIGSLSGSITPVPGGIGHNV